MNGLVPRLATLVTAGALVACGGPSEAAPCDFLEARLDGVELTAIREEAAAGCGADVGAGHVVLKIRRLDEMARSTFENDPSVSRDDARELSVGDAAVVAGTASNMTAVLWSGDYYAWVDVVGISSRASLAEDLISQVATRLDEGWTPDDWFEVRA